MFFQRPQDPFYQNLGAGFAQGLNQVTQQNQEQEAINRILQQQQQGGDYLTSILQSYLPQEKKTQLLSDVGQYQQRQGDTAAKFAEIQRKQQESQAKLQQEQTTSQAQDKFLESMGYDTETIKNLDPVTKRSIIGNVTKKEENSPSNVVAGELLKKDLTSYDSAVNEANRGQKIIDLANKPGTSVGSMRGAVSTALSTIGFDDLAKAVQNADAAQLERLVVEGAPELKQTFGARVTNFDYDKWLSGQPGSKRTQAANVALGILTRNKGLMQQEIFNEIQKIAGLPGQEFIQRRAEIVQNVRNKWDQKTEQDLIEAQGGKKESSKDNFKDANIELLTTLKISPTRYNFSEKGEIILPPNVPDEEIAEFEKQGFKIKKLGKKK